VDEVLTTHWRDALGLDEVGIHDDFFELGGDSLLAVQVLVIEDLSILLPG
jgi:microcystin synthetase protein McyA